MTVPRQQGIQRAESAPVADTPVEGIWKERIPEENAPTEDIPSPTSCSSCGAGISGTTKFCGSCGVAVSPAPAAERTPAPTSCSSCGAGISGTKKFCGSCGAAVSSTPAAESAPVLSEITAHENNGTSHSGSPPAAEPVVNLKSIEELDDLGLAHRLRVKSLCFNSCPGTRGLIV